jgi:hypothetical protein
MAKYYFLGDAKKQQMAGFTPNQMKIYKAVKLKAISQVRKLEINYTDKTISAIRKLTGIQSADHKIIWADFISKINLDIK